MVKGWSFISPVPGRPSPGWWMFEPRTQAPGAWNAEWSTLRGAPRPAGGLRQVRSCDLRVESQKQVPGRRPAPPAPEAPPAGFAAGTTPRQRFG